MFGIESLDVLIGLFAVYLTFSLAVTAIVEAIGTWLGIRSKNLEAALGEFFGANGTDKSRLFSKFFCHPLIQSLSKGTDQWPSYIPKETFGQVIVDILQSDASSKGLMESIDGLDEAKGGWRGKGILKALASQAEGDIGKFRSAVESHFDSAMDRATGWFKRQQQNLALAVSLVVVIGANVDSIAIASKLQSSPQARVKMVELAEKRVAEAQTAEELARKKANVEAASVRVETGSATPGESGKGGVRGAQQDDSRRNRAKNSARSEEGAKDQYNEAVRETQAAVKTLETARADLMSAGLPLGWKGESIRLHDWKALLVKAVGLLISAFALSLGAPFWFDRLKSIMQIRGAGISPNEKKEIPAPK
ncbi:MAG: hypothetical protein K1Y02_15945 [Candidatus Hydrogenedentes bacterium]|nr:hypothetical protein [Candidatus Hydrogenedentota bacterium]